MNSHIPISIFIIKRIHFKMSRHKDRWARIEMSKDGTLLSDSAQQSPAL